MSGTPTLTLNDIRKKLKKLGFKKVRGSKHEIWDDGKGHIVPLSFGNQDVGPTLLKSICSQIGISKKEFFKI